VPAFEQLSFVLGGRTAPEPNNRHATDLVIINATEHS
jgi:hypothetical protein